MKAAVVRQFKQPLVIEERPIPTPAAGEVVVRIGVPPPQARALRFGRVHGPPRHTGRAQVLLGAHAQIVTRLRPAPALPA